MDETQTPTLTDEDITTVVGSGPPSAQVVPDERPGDGTDGDATDGTDGDSQDADGTDGTDSNGTDGSDADGTDEDTSDATS